MSIDFESLKDKAVVAAQTGVTKAKEFTESGIAKARELADSGVAKAKEITEIGKLKVQRRCPRSPAAAKPRRTSSTASATIHLRGTRTRPTNKATQRERTRRTAPGPLFICFRWSQSPRSPAGYPPAHPQG